MARPIESRPSLTTQTEASPRSTRCDAYPPDAIATLTKALAVDPGLANAHNGLGVAYAQQGDFARAIAEWEKAVSLRPDLTDARDNIARARQLMRQQRP